GTPAGGFSRAPRRPTVGQPQRQRAVTVGADATGVSACRARHGSLFGLVRGAGASRFARIRRPRAGAAAGRPDFLAASVDYTGAMSAQPPESPSETPSERLRRLSHANPDEPPTRQSADRRG